MWEYKRKDIRFSQYSVLNEELNKEGNDGWEIISYFEDKPENFGREYCARILYKRQKNNDNQTNNTQGCICY